MASTRTGYDTSKVERLKHLLNSLKEKGKPKSYEVFVDTLKVVEKTEDPAEFDGYQDFIDDDTKELRILIYNTANSPRNDQYIFELKPKAEENKNDELSGTDINTRIDEKLDAERKKWEMDQVKKENEKLKTDLKDAEEYIEKLEAAYQEEKSHKFKLGKINVGELASVALEGIIRRNPQLLSKLPGGEALAGVIEEDNKDKEKALNTPEKESEVTFKKKEAESTPKLSQEDEERMLVVKMMQQSFDEVQLKNVWDIIRKMAEDNSLIPVVKDLLESPQTEETKNN